MKKLLVILGPTATGKTDLALKLANKLNGEIIACDSRQIYKGLDIGTGKMSGDSNVKVIKADGFWTIGGVKIWMYDQVSPIQRYTASDYMEDVTQALEKIIAENKLPIIVGGTGMYIKGLLEGFNNLKIPVDYKLREELEKLSIEQLQKRLKILSQEIFDRLNNSDMNNKRRLLRSIEISTMNPYKKTKNEATYFDGWNILKIGLYTQRVNLNNRIDLRLDLRINQGLIEEAKKLNNEGLSFERMRELGLEYKYLADYLEKKIDYKQFVELLKIKIHQYAKRQMTWFKKDQKIEWFDILDNTFSATVEKYVLDWYNRK